MKDTLFVRAAAGLFVPMEGSPHEYIGEKPVEVAATPYYLRALEGGDLIAAERKTNSKKGGQDGL